MMIGLLASEGAAVAIDTRLDWRGLPRRHGVPIKLRPADARSWLISYTAQSCPAVVITERAAGDDSVLPLPFALTEHNGSPHDDARGLGPRRKKCGTRTGLRERSKWFVRPREVQCSPEE
ncbi:hypothetical protein HPB50_020975 [Hyalomma asiaticum]|uniref:Uncharacterized protein n=1 Tax=Hyalomma asiaticum TaxID=266040 RepID=A0ACB7T317_HYAAI|nr:hypothetical protein HPB50_020975 [Hyalomma asiaticum]